ncbi:hypothetical protein FHQ23_11845 [Testudinibacter sp. TR-2022]|uniref:Imm43 family immunity protein n=1 Tax=Testudinibacter sp. TR-2022 TaxID=2585029 RepID=UPI0011181FF4|nr:Imm43 family immunity protein [Testudinibacter sp. TR-2022]TNH13575.1 hypothetical protein FHQ23_11845 [Testudinibacter sp. TR-2022]
MGKYFAIFEKEEKKAPISLQEGILHSELNIKKPFEPLPTDSGDWRYEINKEVELPSTLWFITRDKEYSFDLRFDSGGFFISKEMLELLNRFKVPDFVFTKLIILNKKLESASTKEYFYLKFFNNKDVIDYSKSKIDFDKKGVLKKSWELQINSSLVDSDVFMIDNWFYHNRLFCNEEFKAACIDNQIYGIQFIDSQDSGIFKN